jgi:hypothetical protein
MSASANLTSSKDVAGDEVQIVTVANYLLNVLDLDSGPFIKEGIKSGGQEFLPHRNRWVPGQATSSAP